MVTNTNTIGYCVAVTEVRFAITYIVMRKAVPRSTINYCSYS